MSLFVFVHNDMFTLKEVIFAFFIFMNKLFEFVLMVFGV